MQERHSRRRRRSERVPTWLAALLVGGTFATLVWWEHRQPLRRQTEAKLRRNARNLAVAVLAAATVQLAERPVTAPLMRVAQQRRLGLLNRWNRMPRWLHVTLALILLDYTLYIWHVLVHKVPLLWRFHKVHHADLDLDTSTAVRFHFGEMATSVIWRAAQIVAIGVSPLALSVWNTLLLMEVMFHHSNARLPQRVERWLSAIVVTPRMHGIHHSIVPEETNSNWSSGLTVWDWLHGTLRRDVPQDQIAIGLPAYRRSDQVTLPKILSMPFTPQPPAWQLSGGGGTPHRATEMSRRPDQAHEAQR